MNTGFQNVKILVVDDEYKAWSVTKRFLETKQYIIDVAFDSDEAMSKVHNFKPDVIILDVLMPGMTGDKLVKVLKQLKPEVQVIVTSGFQHEETKVTCLENGAFAVISKPVDFDDLNKTIEKALKEGSKED